MKNLKYLGGIGLMALALCLPSCDKEDNTDELLSGLNGLEKRVAALEALQGQVDAIQAILDAAANNYLITSVVENKDEEVVTGYTITFSNGETITIQNGKDGEAGITPEISVAEEGGNLYWKVNGQWLMNGENKVPAEGIAPQFKIEDNVWKVSYDGVNFEPVQGSPNPGGTVITCVDKGNYYEFNVGGTVCDIAKYQPLNITFTNTDNFVVAADATSADVAYTITDDATGVSDYIIMAFANSGYTVTIDKSAKKITVDGGGLPIAGQEITILVSDGGQRTIMRSFKFVEDGTTPEEGTTVTIPGYSESTPLSVAATGGEQTITVSSDFALDKMGASISTEAATWISITDDSQIKSRATHDYTLKLKVEANETEQSRSAVITITAGEGESAKTATFKIEQEAAVEESSYTYAYNLENPQTLQEALESALGLEQLQTKTTLVITGTKLLTKVDLQYLRDLSKTYALRNLDLSASATTTIVSEAFSFSKLESIILPETATRIYGAAFRDCASLTSIVIPASVKGISDTAFLRNLSLKTVVFKGKTDLVTENGDPSQRIFEGCTALESITIEHEGELINPGSVDGTNSNNFAGVLETCILYVPESNLETYQADTDGWAKAFPGERIQAIQ